MNRVRGMSGAGRLVVALAIAGAVFGVASAVQASIPDSNGVAHACYYVPSKLSSTPPRPGALRLIDTAKGQHCATDEQPIDLATTQFVTSQINQTSFMLTGTFTYTVVSNYITTYGCPTGYVATDPQIYADSLSNNLALTERADQNVGTAAGGPPNNVEEYVYNVSFVPVAVHQHITCVDGRVYGQSGPAVPFASSQATITTKQAQ